MEQDRNAQPVTAQRGGKRQTRVARMSEERWNRLQLDYRRAVSAEYPNPRREGCPGREALRDLVERGVLREDLRENPRWRHAIQCGPCYEEYLALRGICLVSSGGLDVTAPSPLGIKRSV
jgi:hypothetical protein